MCTPDCAKECAWQHNTSLIKIIPVRVYPPFSRQGLSFMTWTSYLALARDGGRREVNMDVALHAMRQGCRCYGCAGANIDRGRREVNMDVALRAMWHGLRRASHGLWHGCHVPRSDKEVAISVGRRLARGTAVMVARLRY